MFAADLTDGGIGLTDVGTGAAVGEVLGEAVVRLALGFGLELEIDGWREGTFLGALFALSYSAFGALGAYMRLMWKRKFLSSVIALLLASLTAVIGIHGDALFLAVVVIVPLAILGGFGVEVWLGDRRHRSLS